MINSEMILSVIKKITESKTKERRHPSFALFTEICREVKVLNNEEIKKALNALCKTTKIKYGQTINDTYFEIIK